MITVLLLKLKKFLCIITRLISQKMEIRIKTTNFSLLPDIEVYLKDKLNALDKFLPRDESIFADVELAKTTNHHRKGNVFKAEVNISVPGRLIRSQAEEWDLRVAIDKVKNELQLELKKYKEKNSTLSKKGALLAKRIIRGE